MTLLRDLVGGALRTARQNQGRSLRDVAKAAKVSLGYLSEVERGQKEASSEMINAICFALDISLSDVMQNVLQELEVVANSTPVSLVSAEVAVLQIEEAA